MVQFRNGHFGTVHFDSCKHTKIKRVRQRLGIEIGVILLNFAMNVLPFLLQAVIMWRRNYRLHHISCRIKLIRALALLSPKPGTV